jgi:hypothetical protein
LLHRENRQETTLSRVGLGTLTINPKHCKLYAVWGDNNNDLMDDGRKRIHLARAFDHVLEQQAELVRQLIPEVLL